MTLSGNAPKCRVLDSTGFFRWLEHRVMDATGVEPRCCYAPDHEWAEQVQPGQ
jgi:hypothetical protein